MVRVKSEGRSKGCQRCRARKVKCDKASPACSQCLRLGKECSGAVTGMVFLHADISTGLSKTKKVVHAREREVSNEGSSSPFEPSQSPQEFVSLSVSTIGTPRDEHVALDFKSSPTSPSPNTTKTLVHYPSRDLSTPTTPMPIQMDNSHVMTQQYISHWKTILQTEGLPWMSRASSLFTEESNSSSFAIERCVLAVALGYHSKLVKSKSIMVEAYKWYGFAIRKQRNQLEHFHPEARQPTLEGICLPIMLTIFEIMCGTNLTGYSQHIMGAAKMLETWGPEACQEKESQLIFRTVRTQMFSVSVFLRVPSFLARTEWLTIPFEGNEKLATDKVIDILTIIPALLFRVDHLSSSSNSAAVQAIESDALKIKFELDETSSGCSIEGHDHSSDSENGFIMSRNSETQQSPAADCSKLPDCLLVSITSYQTAQALLSWVLSQVSQEPTSRKWETELLARCDSLLDLAEPLHSHHLSGIYVRLAYSLRIVAIVSPSVEQRSRVRRIVDRWRSNLAAGGFCTGIIMAMEEDRKAAMLRRTKILSVEAVE
ncbi:hypothetical protein N431DRAFT_389168 [Stipitochalara longipes BDJ]|nr:hypothetical protein N431DRAFT_389168 [Stipitochalara longipes BDJ]